MATKKELTNQINQSHPDELMKNIHKAYSSCAGNKRMNFEDIWNEVLPAIKAMADQSEIAKLLEQNQHDSLKDDNFPLYCLLQATDLLKNRFVKAYEEEYRRVLYKVTDLDKKIVDVIPEHRQKPVLQEAIRQIGFERDNSVFHTSETSEMVSQWLDFKEDYIEKPEPMLPPDIDGWCLHRPNIFPDSSIDFPTWNSIFIRMDDPRAFAAWIWGVYMGMYEGRQILWIYGPTGEDGKSAMLKILGEELFGPALGAIDNTQIGKNSGFLNSFFTNKKLVIYPDCKNRKVLMKEAFQSIANGGMDQVVVEPKNEKAYFTYLKARAAIASNYLPEITSANFSTSRLLLIELAQATEKRTSFSEYGGRLKAELPGFLAYAKSAYEELCPDDYKITVNESAKANAQKAVGLFEEDHDYTFEKHFEYAEGEMLPANEFLAEMKERAKITDNNKISNFKEYLQNSRNVEILKRNDGNYYKNLKLKGKKGSETPKMDENEV